MTQKDSNGHEWTPAGHTLVIPVRSKFPTYSPQDPLLLNVYSTSASWYLCGQCDSYVGKVGLRCENRYEKGFPICRCAEYLLHNKISVPT